MKRLLCSLLLAAAGGIAVAADGKAVWYKNCAGCHAPGRFNVDFVERRCTLSCQGCHVNPNGSGIRNSYGVWNAQRWARSFKSEFLGSKGTPAPYSRQPYRRQGGTPAKGVPGVLTTAEVEADPADYDKYADHNWTILAKDEKEFLSTIPSSDPYRIERSQSIFAGGDLRYFTIQQQDFDGQGNTRTYSWLMSVDLGVRVKPVRHLSLVLENRLLSPPTNNHLIKALTNESRVRSAYALIDDLPCNSFLMYGVYKPLFGLVNPDHYSLSQTLAGMTVRSAYYGFSAGTAPNIPFLNVNLLLANPSASYDQSKGFVVSLGGRWVSYGANIMVSYWNTSAPVLAGGPDLAKRMLSVSYGATLGPLIYNGEVLRVTKEFAVGAEDGGTVTTHQLKCRVWREIYAEAQYANANVTATLAAGSSSEFMFGFRGYLLPGTEMQALYITRKNQPDGSVENTDNAIQLQGHIFF